MEEVFILLEIGINGLVIFFWFCYEAVKWLLGFIFSVEVLLIFVVIGVWRCGSKIEGLKNNNQYLLFKS